MDGRPEYTAGPEEGEILNAISHPAIVMTRGPDQSIHPLGGLSDVGVDGIRVKLLENSTPTYKTWAEIRLIIPNVPKPEHENQSTEITARIRFGAPALGPGGISATRLTTADEIPACLTQFAKIEASLSEGRLVLVKLKYQPTKVTWISCKRSQPDLTPRHRRELANLFKGVETGELQLYCRASHEPDNFLRKLRTHICQEYSRRDPVLQWHPANRATPFIDPELPTPRAERPKVILPAQLVFTDPIEYLTLQGYAAIQEEEYVQQIAERCAKAIHQLRLITIPGAGNRRYLGFLKFPCGLEFRLRPQDKVRLNFDPELGTDDDDWFGHVTEPLALASPDEVTLIVNRPRDPGNPTQFIGQEVLATSGEIGSFDELRLQLLSSPRNTVSMTVVSSDTTLRRQLLSLRRLMDNPICPTWKRYLLGQDLLPRAHVDMYHGMSHITPSPSLSPSQVRLFNYCRRMPDGISLVTGPPGTGKTHAIVELILPLLQATNQRHPVLVATPGNDPSDVIATAIQDRLNREERYAGKIVIRYHSSNTEREIVWAHARSQRPPHQESYAPLIDEAIISQDVAAMEAAMFIKQHYDRSTARPCPLSNDIRVRLLPQSLAYWMLRVAGIIPGLTLENPQDWRKVRLLYRQYSNGSLNSEEELAEFKLLIQQLHSYVLRRADIVITTLANTADPTLMRNFNPAVVFIDEAGKAAELDVLNIIANYSPRATLLAGDEKQLLPTVFSSVARGNNLAALLRLPLFARLKLAGKESILLREQFRMVSGLSSIPSTVFYASRLVDGKGTEISARPRAIVWANFLESIYNVKGNQIFLDVRGSKCVQGPVTFSRSNSANVHAVIEFLRQAFRYGIKGAEIAIATPYQAQHQLYCDRILQLRELEPELAWVDVRKIDGYQGGQATFVILDMVVTNQLGFVGDRNRINVGMTRCRDGLVMVGDIAALQTVNRRRTGHYRHVVNLFRWRHAIYTT